MGAANPRWADEPSYVTVHKYLACRYPKTGVCENCQKARVTEFALRHGRVLSRERADYLELCCSCHRHYDGGENHYRAKLTWAQVREIRRRYVAGSTSQRKLAAEFGVARTTIGAVVSGRTWVEVS
jgi:DNA-binding XRE family transcriptional regulator